MSAGKHFVSDPKDLVRNSLSGLVSANPHLALDEKEKVTYVKDLATLRTKQVTLFCGGGSGHEPAHAGFVGHGMLTAAVSGHVFASPTSSQVLSCLRRVYSEEHGTLVVIKNYTGDVLNFGRAVERFKSESVNLGKPLPKV
ncbi:Dihydroxyacetone kinase 2, partial [Coemansia sp. RSA 2531]